MIIHDFKQGTEEWFKVRLGKFTASSAQAIANQGKGLETLVLEKVAEIMTGKMPEVYTNADMERGNLLEAEARSSYEIETGHTVKQVGFCELSQYVGCSPDGLVGDDGLLEIKSKNDVNFVKALLVPEYIDPAHVWQMLCQMYVTGRTWCDYLIYNPNFPNPTIITRVMRDEEKIAKLVAGLTLGEQSVKTILAKVHHV